MNNIEDLNKKLEKKEKAKKRLREQLYNKRILEVFATFQYIEFALKAYISFSYNIIRSKLLDSIPFKYNSKDIEDDSFGKLRKQYEKLNDNQELIRKLKLINKKRNKFIHESFMDKLSKPLTNEKVTESYIIDLKEKADDIFIMLLSEIDKLKKIVENIKKG